jgi:hypothetical protein
MTKEHYDYLIALRDSGVTNMWGAAPYLQEYFGLDRKEAKETFSSNGLIALKLN